MSAAFFLATACGKKNIESVSNSSTETVKPVVEKDKPKLIILKSIADATLGKGSDMKKRDTIYTYNSEYFEITLEVMANLKIYRARKTLEETVSREKHYHSVDIRIGV